MNQPSPVPASRLPFVLLGVMTLISFGGPFLIGVLLWGGPRSDWPPDRPIEWIGVGAVLLAFAACFTACLTIRLWHPKPMSTTQRADEPKQNRYL
jgi:hypothetical protein